MESTVAKRRGNKSGDPKMPADTVQFNVRIPADLHAQLERTAELLATDRSHLIRLILAEKLREYEERGRQARGLKEHQ